MCEARGVGGKIKDASRAKIDSPEALPLMFTPAVAAPCKEIADHDSEIFPGKAIASGAAIAATGRFDYPSRINNLLAFPGIFKEAERPRI